MYDLIRANKRRSVLLIIGFLVVVVLIGVVLGYLFGNGPVFTIVALVFGAVMAFTSYWKADKIALAVSRARPADPQEYRRLHNLVEGLCIASGLPKPGVYVIDDPAPNAFATGRNPRHAAIAVTTGLLEKMNRIELEGVLAHELSHIKNDDILVSTLAVTMVGVVALLADMGVRMLWFGGGRRSNDNNGGNVVTLVLAVAALVLIVLSPIIAQLMQFAVSRRRETLADMSGVEMTRYPPGLISALQKLQADQTVVRSASRATAHLWIESPLARTPEEGKMSKLNRLFDTHPPLEERIAALQEL
ncbi:MAG: M48 family metallopeptidase [Acidimicrobiales bacterium]|nr:M48 family metallopeptidase [Acidimicrobiales bacterium]